MTESLACRTPVLSLANGAAPEVVRPGVTEGVRIGAHRVDVTVEGDHTAVSAPDEWHVIRA